MVCLQLKGNIVLLFFFAKHYSWHVHSKIGKYCSLLCLLSSVYSQDSVNQSNFERVARNKRVLFEKCAPGHNSQFSRTKFEFYKHAIFNALFIAADYLISLISLILRDVRYKGTLAIYLAFLHSSYVVKKFQRQAIVTMQDDSAASTGPSWPQTPLQRQEKTHSK